MTTEYLYEFIMLSRLHSYSKAAKALFISQSMLTRHIQEMEKELDAKLLNRSSHNATLTEAGRVLARHAEEIIRQAGRATDMLLQETGAPIGHLRIACELEISYASHVKAFITRFRERYYNIELSIDVIPGRNLPELLEHYDIILTPCRWIDLPQTVRFNQIYNHSTYLIVPPGHRLMGHSAIPLSQLVGETVIVPFSDELFGPFARNWLLIDRACRGKAIRLPVDSIPTAVLQIGLGAGVMVAPRYVRNLVPSDVSGGSFVVAIADAECSFQEYIYCSTFDQNNAARMFYEEMTEKLLPARE